MYMAQPVGDVAIFKQRLLHRLKLLAQESGRSQFVMPVGLVLVIDKQNGGDVTAQELVDRFGVVDMESRNLIDFYFLGWHRTQAEEHDRAAEGGDNHQLGKSDQNAQVRSRAGDAGPPITFDLGSFEKFRTTLREAGVGQFGG